MQFFRGRHIVVACLSALALVALVGCSGDDDGGNEAGANSTTPTPIPNADADIVGGIVSELYLEMFDELFEVVNTQETGDAVQNEIAAIYDRYRPLFVDLAWQVSYLPEDQHDLAQFAYEGALYNADARRIGWIPTIFDFYKNNQPAVATQIEAMNSITEATFYWELRDRDPAEADRLGVP